MIIMTHDVPWAGTPPAARRFRPLILVVALGISSLAVLSSCSMPIVAPTITSGEIPIRNEIDRTWRVFTANLTESRLDDAWDGMSTRLQKTEFRNDRAAFQAWVAREEKGLLQGVSGSWLFQLRLSAGAASARPEGMNALKEVRFIKQRGQWRVDNWIVVPEPR